MAANPLNVRKLGLSGDSAPELIPANLSVLTFYSARKNTVICSPITGKNVNPEQFLPLALPIFLAWPDLEG